MVRKIAEDYGVEVVDVLTGFKFIVEKIKAIMNCMRENGFQTIAGYVINEVKDYSNGIDGMPKSNILKLFFDKGWFAVRPSGTEPKIKFYYEFEGG